MGLILGSVGSFWLKRTCKYCPIYFVSLEFNQRLKRSWSMWLRQTEKLPTEKIQEKPKLPKSIWTYTLATKNKIDALSSGPCNFWLPAMGMCSVKSPMAGLPHGSLWANPCSLIPPLTSVEIPPFPWVWADHGNWRCSLKIKSVSQIPYLSPRFYHRSELESGEQGLPHFSRGETCHLSKRLESDVPWTGSGKEMSRLPVRCRPRQTVT